MTVKKATKCGGYAAIVARQRLQNANHHIDMLALTKPQSPPSYNIVVGFNEKDHLQLITKDDKEDDKRLTDKASKQESIAIDDIIACDNIETYPNCTNTLVFYTNKSLYKEAIAVKFENEQDFKRIYFTYKYFKMRNKLTKTSTSFVGDGFFSKKKTEFKNRKNSVDDFAPKVEFDLNNQRNDNLTHITVKNAKNSRFDQPMSLIGIRTDTLDEIDSIIYTDVDVPAKPDRKRLFQRNKQKAPLPPNNRDQIKVLKGEYVRVNVERSPDVIPKDNKLNKIPDILVFRESKSKSKINPASNLWTATNKVSAGYESDREEWRSSRSQFSTTAFDSLARPTKMAMALTLRKPPRLEPVQYYRLADTPINPLPFRPSYLQRPVPRPAEKKPLTVDHRKFTSLQNLDVRKLPEPKKLNEKKTNYSNISNRITGLTNKLRDLGSATNTIGRFKAQSQNDVSHLKPVLKCKQDGAKRPVVRTCSAEPPKKVTFSAFATVQVV